jgi:hypothetical protein
MTKLPLWWQVLKKNVANTFSIVLLDFYEELIVFNKPHIPSLHTPDVGKL